jgi:hypothetical protein
MTAIWIGFGFFCLLLFAWMVYMMTFRTDDWLRMVKNEQERKAQAEKLKQQRDQRIGTAVKGALSLAEKFLKK